MSKSKPTAGKPEAEKKAAKPAPVTWERTLRETVESVAIAFILAFLFRTFEAEAFVIPTGSMAPTLQGRHKDVDCPKCGYHYRVSASCEVDSEGAPKKQPCHVVTGICPMCGYTLDVGSERVADADYPSYNGDRIIVNKFAYDVSDPQRWDVVVFKYPNDAKTNYIKRLVGLPNERLQVRYGDVYTAPLGSNDFRIARKSPEKLRAMLQPVYDNDYVLPTLIEAGIEPRWQPWAAGGQASPWKTSADYKSFTADGSSVSPAWLRYQHEYVDATNDNTWDRIWELVARGQRVASPPFTHITDDYAFNDGTASPPGCEPPKSDPNFVGDLAIDCQLVVTEAKGDVILELVKGGRQFRCKIELSSGKATLSIDNLPDFAPQADTSIHGPGTYDVSFSNVDEQLLLWIDGRVVAFNAETTYPYLGNVKPVERPAVRGSDRPEEATDLSPAGIAVERGAAVEVHHLRIWRDIYYTADARTGRFAESQDRSRSVDLHENEFFMMGDNSPASSDSRFWGIDHKVDRRLLIGKALFIYWPHSWAPSWALPIRLFGTELKVPFWPNFKRMTFVH